MSNDQHSNQNSSPAHPSPTSPCEPYWRLMDLPASARTAQEQRSLSAHLAECPACEQLEGRLRRALDVYAAWPSAGEMSPGLARRLEGLSTSVTSGGGLRVLDGGQSQPISRPRRLPEPAGVSRSWMVALAASLLMSVVGYGLLTLQNAGEHGPFEGSWEDGAVPQHKGPPSSHPLGPGVELTLLLERADGTAQRLPDRAAIPAGAGLLFEVSVAPGKFLAEILTRTPDGRVERLYPAEDSQLRLKRWELGLTHPGEARVFTLEMADGTPARYEPDSEPGEHQFAAVVRTGSGATPERLAPELVWAMTVEGAAPPAGIKLPNGLSSYHVSVFQSSRP